MAIGHRLLNLLHRGRCRFRDLSALSSPTATVIAVDRHPFRISDAAGGKSYKEQKELERRARAGDSTGWNASFVRSDTVVDALADRLGVGKGDILDREEVRL